MLRSFVTAASVAADMTGLGRALAPHYAGRGSIFSFHSVVDDDAFYLDSLRYRARKLEWLLGWLRQQETDFISIDEVADRLRAPSRRRFAVFTFDDGYADNLTHALPIMERFRAPFTVYVTSGMITREIDAWWLGLAALIRLHREIELPGLGRFACADLAAKKRTFSTIERAIHKDSSLLEPLRQIIDRANIDCSALVDQEALTEQQLRQLSRHSLVTIGAHTVTHCNLARSSAAEVHWEMASSRKYLEELVDRPVLHFAYPFGDLGAVGTRELEIAHSVGFRTAVTTCHGAVFSEHLRHLHALPRVPIWSHDARPVLRCKFYGLYRAYHSRLGDPIFRMTAS